LFFFSKTLTPCIFVIVHISKKRQRKKNLFFEALLAGERKAPTLESPCIIVNLKHILAPNVILKKITLSN